MTERRIAYCLLAAVIPLCAAQYAVKVKIGEPYPAVIMPSFGGDSKPVLVVKTPTLVITKADGAVRETSAYDLFLDLSDSQNVTLVDRGLAPDRTLPPDAAEWIWRRVLRIEPNASAALIRWTRNTPLTNEPSTWLGDLAIR